MSKATFRASRNFQLLFSVESISRRWVLRLSGDRLLGNRSTKFKSSRTDKVRGHQETIVKWPRKSQKIEKNMFGRLSSERGGDLKNSVGKYDFDANL